MSHCILYIVCVLPGSLSQLQRIRVGKGEQRSADTGKLCFSLKRKMQYIEKQGFIGRKKNVCRCCMIFLYFFFPEFSIFSILRATGHQK